MVVLKLYYGTYIQDSGKFKKPKRSAKAKGPPNVTENRNKKSGVKNRLKKRSDTEKPNE